MQTTWDPQRNHARKKYKQKEEQSNRGRNKAAKNRTFFSYVFFFANLNLFQGQMREFFVSSLFFIRTAVRRHQVFDTLSRANNKLERGLEKLVYVWEIPNKFSLRLIYY